MEYIMTDKLALMIDDMVSDYSRPTEIDDGLYYDQKEIIRRINFYSQSEYISGRKDKYNRRKPFKNKVNEHVDAEVTGTDVDFNQILLKAENGKYVKTMLLRRELLQWAKDTNFSESLNNLNEVFCRYGGVIAKRTVCNGEMFIDAVDWKNVITNKNKIDGSPIIEIHKLSRADLAKKKKVWNGVNDILNTTIDEIVVYEVEGFFEMNLFGGDAGIFKKMHVFIADVNGKKQLLFSEEVVESIYKYKKRRPQIALNRALGIGVVEEGFEAQIAVNEVAYAEHMAFQIGGKILAKTNADNPNNVNLSSLEDGTVVKLENGEYLEPLILAPSTLPEYQRLTNEWDINYRRQTGVQDLTDEIRSSTPYSTVALNTKLSSGRSDYRRENFAFFVKEKIEDWVLPYLVEKIRKEHLLTTEFSTQELNEIDTAFRGDYVRSSIMQSALQGIEPDVLQMRQEAMSLIQKGGKERTIKVPAGFFSKDILNDVTVLIDNEFIDRRSQMQSLYEIYNSMSPQDENRKQIFNQLTELGGVISPISFAQVAQQPVQQIQQSAKSAEIESLVPQAQR